MPFADGGSTKNFREVGWAMKPRTQAQFGPAKRIRTASNLSARPVSPEHRIHNRGGCILFQGLEAHSSRCAAFDIARPPGRFGESYRTRNRLRRLRSDGWRLA